MQDAELTALKAQIEDSENEQAALNKRAADIAARHAVLDLSLTALRARVATLTTESAQ